MIFDDNLNFVNDEQQKILQCEKILFEKFSSLSLEDKRNELNIEMIKLFELVSKVLAIKNNNFTSDVITNYEKNGNISESEYLNECFKNFIKLRRLIINYTALQD